MYLFPRTASGIMVLIWVSVETGTAQSVPYLLSVIL